MLVFIWAAEEEGCVVYVMSVLYDDNKCSIKSWFNRRMAPVNLRMWTVSCQGMLEGLVWKPLKDATHKRQPEALEKLPVNL